MALAIPLLLLAASADAQDGTGEGAPVVDVVEVSGYLDPVVVEFLSDAIASAERDDVEALVIQLNSPGSLVSAPELDSLTARVARSPVPIAVWVGPSGAEALRGAARLVTAAPLAGLAPRSRLGLPTGTIGPEEAFDQGVVAFDELDSSVLRTFLIALDGEEVGDRVIETADFEQAGDGGLEATLSIQARLAKLPVGPRLLHTVASPPVAYLLLCVGLVLLVFEFFTAGVGVAGVVGAVSLVLAAYGLGVLPTSPLGLVLLAMGTFGFAVDVQTGAPRLWTGVGVVSFAVGSLLLFDEGVTVGWLPLVVGVVGVVLMMLAGLPATVRSRFSTPTIGRSSMVGEMGEAVADVHPDGVVKVRDALWPARTNRATPIASGDRVRVVGIDGTRLEVEPETGGARDHRARH